MERSCVNCPDLPTYQFDETMPLMLSLGCIPETPLQNQGHVLSSMPEGPEIRRAADRIGKALVGKVIEDGNWPFPTLQQADSLILGHEVLSVTSRAKAMLIRFSSGWTMYSHNQLYGRWTVHLKTTDPRSNRSLRAEFLTDKHAVIK